MEATTNVNKEKRQRTAVIIGAGPAGLTAAYELLDKTDVKPVILEMTGDIGGISRTIDYKGNRIDIGGHRFFSRSDRVMRFWLDILPLQGGPAGDEAAAGSKLPTAEEMFAKYCGGRRGSEDADERSGPDPEREDKVWLIRRRLSRIFFMRRFFDYPLSLSLRTVAGLGVLRTVRITLSYLKARLFAIRQERSLEDFFINRFGRELYRNFFKDYTQKVWGVPCSRIKPEWGAQRIKGLSIGRAIADAVRALIWRDTSIGQKRTETTLIRHFMYPKFGPGQLWQEVARKIESKGGVLRLGQKVTGLKSRDGRVIEVEVANQKTGETERVSADYFFSSMPVKDLIAAMGDSAPGSVREVAEGLVYRDFITVGLLLKHLKVRNETKGVGLVPDNWVYIQEKEVKLGRLQIFNNWSPYMVRDKDTVWLGLEYFCTEGDELWSKSDTEMAGFAAAELASIGIIDAEDVLDSVVIRVEKTYPAYFGSYERFDVIREYVDGFENLFLVGRNGMHRYNNQDHSMLTAMAAVGNVADGSTRKDNVWAINAEGDYHERRLTALENLIEGYIERISEAGFEYNPDIYWEKTGIPYPHYPTVRHRKRFIVNSIRGFKAETKDLFVFVYGCGEGDVLKEVRRKLGLSDEQLGGCDISDKAIEAVRREVDSRYLYKSAFPRLDRKCDIIICSELIEHTRDFPEVLHWIKDNLSADGLLILTTQSGKIHASDRYTGHTQHFDIGELNRALKRLGFEVERSRLWGFPFFSLQKYLTDVSFEKVRSGYLEGNLTCRKRLVFGVAYLLYFVHDLIGFGPQIYIVASNNRRG